MAEWFDIDNIWEWIYLIEFHGEFLTELNTAYNSKYESLCHVFDRYILESN